MTPGGAEVLITPRATVCPWKRLLTRVESIDRVKDGEEPPKLFCQLGLTCAGLHDGKHSFEQGGIHVVSVGTVVLLWQCVWGFVGIVLSNATVVSINQLSVAATDPMLSYR